MSNRIQLAVVVIIGSLFFAAGTYGATFNPGDAAGLISAINTANSNNQDDTINLVANGSYVLTTVQDPNLGASGLPVITSDSTNPNVHHSVTINGNGATLTRSTSGGTPEFRLLRIANQNAFSKSVTINDLTLTNGLVSNSGGGAISSNGILILNNCTISNNSAGEAGGILNNVYQTTLNNCTLAGNHATNGTGGALMSNGGNLNVNTCTIVNNSSTGAGDGIMNLGSVGQTTAAILNSTFSGNGIANYELGWITNTTLGNTLLNASDLLNGPNNSSLSKIASMGYNLSSDNGGGYLTATGDQTSTDPRLDPLGLRDNGGTIQTIALLSDSPAIDKGKNFGLTNDQRGYVRPFDLPAYVNASGGDGSDIGALESLDPVQAGSTFQITTTQDHDDGSCTVGDCTLRDAIIRANALPGANIITFENGIGATITLTLGELGVSESLTINGPGARSLAISGNQAHRVFNFSAGSNTVSGLTIQDGAALGVIGSGRGGGIYNASFLTVIDCAFLNNKVTGYIGTQPGEPGGFARGGAAANDATLVLTRCTFSGNTATGGKGANSSIQGGTGGAGGGAQGGAVFNTIQMVMTNCTVSGNSGTGGNGGNDSNSGHGGNGGDAFGSVFNQGTMTMTACTVSGNTGTGGTAGTGSINNGANGAGRGSLTANAGTSTLGNTLSAGNGVSDALGAFTSSGYNLIGNGAGSSGITGTADQVGTGGSPINPLLGPLQNNGGFTDTMLIGNGSPAVDQGKAFALTTDQRGITRPLDQSNVANASGGDGSDIGATEVDTAQVGPTLIVNTIGDHTDGVCGFADCTLREAITAANGLAGDNTITFLPGLTGTIQMTGAFSNLATNITLQGPGANLLTVRGTGGGSVLTIGNGTTTGPTVSISGLTITNGFGSGGYGGGLRSDHSNLTVTGCALVANQADQGGAGLFNDAGTIVVRNCTFNNNTASFGGGLYSRAIAAGAVATATVTNCTFFNNSANDSGSTGYGGGILNLAASNGSATMTVSNCTLSVNSARLPTLGGAIHNRQVNPATATVSLGSNILKKGPNGANLVNDTGTITSQGFNISSDPPTGPYLSQPTDRTSLDPQINTLAKNGGPTQTCSLITGSPAIDQGKNLSGLTTDQRGQARIFDDGSIAPATGGDNSDIGAFELGPAIPSVAAASRKTHAGAGVFDIGLPATAPAGVECRTGGASGIHQVIMTFPAPVVVSSANATPDPSVSGSTALVSGYAVNGNQVSVDLTSVSNAQRITVTLSGVTDGTTTSDVSIPMAVLLGDTNGDGSVNSADIAQTKSKSGQTVDSTNFRNDIGADGSLNSADISLVKSRSGTALP